VAVAAPLEMVAVVHVLLAFDVVVVLAGFWGLQRMVEEMPQSNRLLT